jgi:hypothetical protein
VAYVKLNDAEIQRLLRSPQGPVAMDLIRRSNRVVNQAKRLCPVDEGRLRSSLASELRQDRGDLVARVGTNLDYGLFIHEGTGIYAGKGPITPKRGKYLRWPVKNNSGQGRRRYKAGATAQYAYARKVKGVKGRPYLRNALPAGLG